jgi:hypothetical protein
LINKLAQNRTTSGLLSFFFAVNLLATSFYTASAMTGQ